MHSFITESAWPFFSVTGERRIERDRQVDEERRGGGGGGREGNRWRDIETDGDGVFMHVCGHMYASVCSVDAKKKVGQQISHHLLQRRKEGEERGWREE